MTQEIIALFQGASSACSVIIRDGSIAHSPDIQGKDDFARKQSREDGIDARWRLHLFSRVETCLYLKHPTLAGRRFGQPERKKKHDDINNNNGSLMKLSYAAVCHAHFPPAPGVRVSNGPSTPCESRRVETERLSYPGAHANNRGPRISG